MLRLSWSALRNHETCKEQAFHRRQGRKSKVENTRNFFPGTVVDRVVRDWLTEDPSPGLMPDMVEAIVEREYQVIQDSEDQVLVWKSGQDRAKVIADCREAVTKIEPHLMKFVVPYDYQPDFGFKAPVTLPHPNGGSEQVLLIGYMDILVRDDRDRWWVHDVKMTRDNSYWRKTRGQLTFYDLAVEIMFGKPTVRTTLMQPMCDEQVKPFKIEEDERAQMLQRIAGMARDIWTNNHPPRTDNVECGYCPVKHACSKFQPVQIDGKRRVALL